MKEIFKKVEKELEELDLKVDDVANENIINACIAKVVLVDNLKKEGIDFDEIEEKLFPDSTFVNQMILHLDDGGSGDEIISKFVFEAVYYSPKLQDALELSQEE